MTAKRKQQKADQLVEVNASIEAVDAELARVKDLTALGFETISDLSGQHKAAIVETNERIDALHAQYSGLLVAVQGAREDIKRQRVELHALRSRLAFIADTLATDLERVEDDLEAHCNRPTRWERIKLWFFGARY